MIMAMREVAAQERAAHLQRQLTELAAMDGHVVDLALVLARAMNKSDPYVMLIECAPGSSLQVTNLGDQPVKLARFLERFARRARRDAA